MRDVEAAAADKPEGTDGAVVSPAACVVADAILEYPDVFPAASRALTLYRYVVPPVSPVSDWAVDDGVAICEKFVQLAP